MGRLELRVLSSVDELRANAGPWDDLWLRSDVKIPVARAEALALWLDHFAPGSRFVGLTVFDDDRMVAALPLYANSRLPLSRLRLPGNFWSAAGDLLLDSSIDSATALDVHAWSQWSDGRGAHRAARVIERVANQGTYSCAS